jgi:predicted nuclease of predicted toxin-antitoxin system
MLFKIDENLHEEIAERLRLHGHDAVSVHDQHMRGSTDDELAAVCQREGCAILTQDQDFANILAFPPEQYAEIIVLRLHDPGRSSALAAMRRLLRLLGSEPLSGYLWTVDDAAVRIRPGKSS